MGKAMGTALSWCLNQTAWFRPGHLHTRTNRLVSAYPMIGRRISFQRKGIQYAQDQSNGTDRGWFWVGTAAVARSALPDLAGLRVHRKDLQLPRVAVEVGIGSVHPFFIVGIVSVHLCRQPERLIAQLLRTVIDGGEIHLRSMFGRFW